MLNLINPDHWRKARADYMTAARACRETLTRQDGGWRYSPNDLRVQNAVGKWVKRARNAHAIALGGKPVIERAIVSANDKTVQGVLYAPGFKDDLADLREARDERMRVIWTE